MIGLKRLISLLLGVILCFSLVSIVNAEDARAVGDVVTFGTYEQDNDLTNGPEPIEWIVLDVKDGKAMLLSKYILDAKPFNEELNDHVWGTSSIRKWLNDEFMNDAFTDDEQAAIIVTEVDNRTLQNENWYNGADDTLDLVFLLSYFEATKYNVTSTQSLNGPSEYAEPKVELYQDTRNDGIIKANGDYFLAYWWLRTPASWNRLCVCRPSGNSDYGEYRISSLGIRPAMWVDLEKYTQPVPEPAEPESFDLIPLTASVTQNTTLADTPWKLWLPDGFEADELTENDLAENYIGYYLRGDEIIAVQYSDTVSSLTQWRDQLIGRGFTIEGLYDINGSEAVLYRNDDTMTASVFDGKGKLLEVTFYPYSEFSEEADQVISSIQREAGKQRLSGAASTASDASAPSTPTTTIALSPEQLDTQYQEMQKAYRDHNYQDSYAICEQLGDYKDADQYLTRLKARLCYSLKLDDKEVQTLVKNMLIDMDFEDTTDVLVCNYKVARYYFQGVWRNQNGMYSFEVEKNGGLTTTLPVVPYAGDSTALIDGIYYRFFEGDWDHRSECFRFEPVSRNKMIVYTYQTRQSIELTKRY